MDAFGVDPPTALVCGTPSAQTRALARELALRGLDVHLRDDVDLLGDASAWSVCRLHGADDDEAALLAAVGGAARRLCLVVVAAGADPRTASAARVLTLQHGPRERWVDLRGTGPAVPHDVVGCALDGARAPAAAPWTAGLRRAAAMRAAAHGARRWRPAAAARPRGR